MSERAMKVAREIVEAWTTSVRLSDLAWPPEKLHERIAAALDAAAPEWLDISTAPRTGRQMMLLLGPSGFPQVAYSNTWWQGGFSVECKPTHYMLIPAPPQKDATDE